MSFNQKHVDTIIKLVLKSAESTRYNAAMGGEWGDGGANRIEERLNNWLDGIKYATTGKTQLYCEIIDQLEKEDDHEYQKYLELKKKFETSL